MGDLRLRRTWADINDDWSVRSAAGTVVGRIYWSRVYRVDPWLWFLQMQPVASGHAASLDEAKAAFRAAYEQHQRALPKSRFTP